MYRLKYALILLIFASCASNKNSKTSFTYSDLSLFNETLTSLEIDQDTINAFKKYLDNSSAGLKGWSDRFNVSEDLFKKGYQNYEVVYSRLSSLETPLRNQENKINTNLDRLREITKTDIEIPVYYLISNQHLFAGTPVFADSVLSVGIAVGIKPDSDLNFNADYIAELLSYVVVHEAAHIIQVNNQDGLENYRSIYDPKKGSMAAVALREGCAEYVTYLASGERYADRHIFVENNEEELWNAFKNIAFEPPFSVPGWFSGKSPSNPQWPFQVGYSVGFKMCESYHKNIADYENSVKELVTLYDNEDIKNVLNNYEKSF